MAMMSDVHVLATPYEIPCNSLMTNNMNNEDTKKYVNDMNRAPNSAIINILFLPTNSTYLPRRSLDANPPMT